MARRVDVDTRWLRRCLELSRQAEGRTAPNPIVGCVIVDGNGRKLAEGFHARAGQPHAEAMALAKLAGHAPGATAYVSLEPCAHHGRTPPCADALIAAGITRVVYGAADPIAQHSGGGERLRRAGIEVVGGVLADECEAANAGFFTHARLGRPHVLLKAGISLDGRVATSSGESKFITGPEARADAHTLRNRLDVIMVGIGTVLADDPKLTCRGVVGGRDPVRVIVDGRLRTPLTAALLPSNSGSTARTIIACRPNPPLARRTKLEKMGAEVWPIAEAAGGVSLRTLLRRLGNEGFRTVLVEGGARLHGALLGADLADEVRLYQAPIVLGSGPAWATIVPAPGLAFAPKLGELTVVGSLGNDLVLTARVHRRARPRR